MTRTGKTLFRATKLIVLTALLLIVPVMTAMADEPPPAADRPVAVRANQWLLPMGGGDAWANTAVKYGSADDVRVIGDWNGNGQATPGVVRGNRWLLRNSNTSGHADITFSYGSSEWADDATPVVGDWDGDGVTTIGWVRHGIDTSTWLLRNSNSPGHADIRVSLPGGREIVGDFDDDFEDNGSDGIGFVRGGRWHVDHDLDGQIDLTFRYGSDEDTPMVGDWNQDYVDDPTVVRGNRWLARYSTSTGTADLTFRFGSPSDGQLVADVAQLPVSAYEQEQPSSSSCPQDRDEVVTMTLQSDGSPHPRCATVVGYQRLRFVNRNSNTVVVRLGGFEAELETGESVVFSQRFREYLEKGGVHNIRTGQFSGGELRLLEEQPA